MDEMPKIPLPTVSLTPTLETERWVLTNRRDELYGPRTYCDDEGDTYLVIPCRAVEVTITVSLEDMRDIVAALQERLLEIAVEDRV
jgi:hypothetical protein